MLGSDKLGLAISDLELQGFFGVFRVIEILLKSIDLIYDFLEFSLFDSEHFHN